MPRNFGTSGDMTTTTVTGRHAEFCQLNAAIHRWLPQHWQWAEFVPTFEWRKWWAVKMRTPSPIRRSILGTCYSTGAARGADGLSSALIYLQDQPSIYLGVRLTLRRWMPCNLNKLRLGLICRKKQKIWVGTIDSF